MPRRIRPAVYWLLAGAAIWCVILVTVPIALRAAYAERLGPLNRLIEGRNVHSVEFYLAAWREVAVGASLALLAAAAGLLLTLRYAKQIKAAFSRAAEKVPQLRAGQLLMVTALLAFAGGFAESLRWIIEHFLLHRVTSKAASLDLIWMTPLSALAILLPLALLVVAASRRAHARAHAVRGLAAVAFCFAVIYALASVLPLGIHWIARVLLCLGLTTFFMQKLAEHPERIVQASRRGVIASVVIIATVAAALPLLGFVRYNRSTRSAIAAQQGAPNIIVIIWDTVRAASMSLYGYARPTTPNLDRLAQRAVVFDRAVSPAPWTLPAHASMFTGLYHHQHSADRNSPLDDSALTIAEYLRQRGYLTAGFIGNTYWVGSKFGLGQGFAWYEDRPTMTPQSVLFAWSGSEYLLKRFVPRARRNQLERVAAHRRQASFLRWLDDRDKDRPFFAFLNHFDAHEPYLPPSGDFRFSADTPLYNWNYLTSKRRWSPSELQDLRDAYDACIYYLDEQLGKLHDELGRRGLLDNTLIVLTSDHGETLGEQDPRLLGHAHNVYYDVLSVPLVFYWPAKFAKGSRVSPLVSTVDLAATLAEAAGGAAAGPPPFPGTSLWPLLTGAQPTALSPALSLVNPAGYHKTRDVFPTAGGSLHSLVTPDGMHYIANARGAESLFDVTNDPWERTNLAATPEGSRLIPKYREELARLVPGSRVRRADHAALPN